MAMAASTSSFGFSTKPSAAFIGLWRPCAPQTQDRSTMFALGPQLRSNSTHHCALMSAALIIGHHLSISAC
jgi:hypothetical protein